MRPGYVKIHTDKLLDKWYNKKENKVIRRGKRVPATIYGLITREEIREYVLHGAVKAVIMIKARQGEGLKRAYDTFCKARAWRMIRFAWRGPGSKEDNHERT